MNSFLKKFAIATLYTLAFVQGIGFTTMPGLSNYLTSLHGFGFTASQYGSLFIPMILGAILAALLGGILAKKHSLKALTLVAILCNIFAMAGIGASAWKIQEQAFTFPLLMTAMVLLGLGFGANITALNPFVVHFFPRNSSSALTALHSCLGIGTAVGPLLLNISFSLHAWWIEPLLISIIYAILGILALTVLPKSATIEDDNSGNGRTASNRLLAIFAFIALLYGITETTFGNWANIYLKTEKNLSQIDANYALSTFWGAVTVGRILATFINLKVAPKITFRMLSFIILLGIGMVEVIFSMPSAIVAFALAGIGCSAFLPLTIHFGMQNFLTNSSFASGLLIAVYMLGYGIAAEGIGTIHKNFDISFHEIYLWLGALVVILGALSFLGAKKNTRV